MDILKRVLQEICWESKVPEIRIILHTRCYKYLKTSFLQTRSVQLLMYTLSQTSSVH